MVSGSEWECYNRHVSAYMPAFAYKMVRGPVMRLREHVVRRTSERRIEGGSGRHCGSCGLDELRQHCHRRLCAPQPTLAHTRSAQCAKVGLDVSSRGRSAAEWRELSSSVWLMSGWSQPFAWD